MEQNPIAIVVGIVLSLKQVLDELCEMFS